MTNKISQPNIALDLLRIHKVISRGLLVGKEKGAEFMQSGFPDAGIRKGYAIFIKGLTVVLGAHHLSEDEVAFPFLREKLPSAPYERLVKSHQEIEALLDTLRKVLPDMEEEGDVAGLIQVVDGLRIISDIWRPHIQTEETYFSENALAEMASPEEQGRVSAAMAKHSQEHATPGYLALPFVLYNLAAEDRERMAASLPCLVVEELIPNAWKGLWDPMKPFLLE
jgi:hypothetical protein